MRAQRLIVAATAVLASCLLAFVFAPSAGAAGAHYVALGDSYSSGVGAGGDVTGGDCNRSSNAYPAQWAASHSPASFTFAACSGATTDDVLASQVAALSADTTLVSITIGGNDAGFSHVIQTCVLGSTDDCVAAVNTARAFIADTLPGKLDNTLRTIRSDAPNATVDVLDYPEFYDLSQSDGCLGLSNTDRVAINGASDDLAGALSAAAGRAGDTFADVRPHFGGHELCDSDEWLHSVTFPVGDSYHPTSSGQLSAYLPTLNSVTG